MIDHHAEIGMAVEQAAEVREVRRPDQGVEGEVARGDGPESGANRRPEHPVHVGEVVQHRPEPPQTRIAGELGHDLRGIRGVERRPAHHPGDEGRCRRDLEEEPNDSGTSGTRTARPCADPRVLVSAVNIS